MHRRTNYYDSTGDPQNIQQRKWNYPLPLSGGVYSPNLVVMRDTENNGYAWLREPQLMSFVAVSAISRPKLSWSSGVLQMDDHVAQIIKSKIRLTLAIGITNGHDAIVLGAFGCGAFRCPPNHIAQLFAEVFEEEDYKGKYKTISFAIFDDHNSHHDHNPEGNLLPFQRRFLKNFSNVEPTAREFNDLSIF